MTKQVPEGYKQTPVGVIPEDWEVVKLGDIATINPTNNKLPDDFIYIDLESVAAGKLLKEYRVLKELAPSRAQRVLAKNDILFQMVRPYQMNNLFFQKEGNFVASTGYAQLRTKYDGKYLFQYLHLKKFVDCVLEKCTGSNYPAINSKDLSRILILLPPQEEQEKIAEILSTWDDAITKQEELIEQKQQFKKSIMQQIFSQKLRFKDDDGSDYPAWEEKKLGDVIICLDNKRIPINSEERTKIRGNIPYYGANGIVDYISKFIFDEQLVLLAEDGGNFDEYLTRPIAQLISGKSWVNNHAHVIKGSSENYTPFVFYSLVHKDIRQWINGTSRSKLNKSDMFLIKTLVPITLKEQQKVADFLMTIDNEITKQNEVLAELKTQKKSLMQKLLTGQIRVKI
jgi:type I restriction enzyme S subunit